MLLDVLDQHAAEADCELALWYTPDGGADWFESHAPRALPAHCRRRAPTWPSGWRALFRFHAREGVERIVLRGTDSPTLPAARAREAFAALERCPARRCVPTATAATT